MCVNVYVGGLTDGGGLSDRCHTEMMQMGEM